MLSRRAIEVAVVSFDRLDTGVTHLGHGQKRKSAVHQIGDDTVSEGVGGRPMRGDGRAST